MDELLARAHRMIDMAHELNTYNGDIRYYASVSLEKDYIYTHVSRFFNGKQYTRAFTKLFLSYCNDAIINDGDGTKGEAYLRMLVATIRKAA